jgi:hypothetical protein
MKFLEPINPMVPVLQIASQFRNYWLVLIHGVALLDDG